MKNFALTVKCPGSSPWGLLRTYEETIKIQKNTLFVFSSVSCILAFFKNSKSGPWFGTAESADLKCLKISTLIFSVFFFLLENKFFSRADFILKRVINIQMVISPCFLKTHVFIDLKLYQLKNKSILSFVQHVITNTAQITLENTGFDWEVWCIGLIKWFTMIFGVFVFSIAFCKCCILGALHRAEKK